MVRACVRLRYASRVASRDAHDKLMVRYRGAAVSSGRRAAGRAAGRVLIDVITAM